MASFTALSRSETMPRCQYPSRDRAAPGSPRSPPSDVQVILGAVRIELDGALQVSHRRGGVETAMFQVGAAMK